MLLSIVTASYNRVELLKKNYKFLKSKINDLNFEWIIIYEKNDLKTKKYLKTIKDKFVKKKASTSEDADIAYNIGFKIAKGKYINIHGDDDYFDKKNFKKLKYILDSDKEWIICQAEYVDNNFKKIRYMTTKIKKLLLNNYNSNILTLINFVMTPSIFFKKDKLKKVGGYNDKIKYGSDYIFWLNFNKLFKPLIFNIVISYVRFDSKTKTGSFNLSRYLIFLREMKKFSKNKFYRIMQYNIIILTIIINFFFKKFLRIY